MISTLAGKIFGTKNDKLVKGYLKRVERINALESEYKAMDDTALKAFFEELKGSVQKGEMTLEDVMYDSFAITREASRRTTGMRHHDVQMVGGLVLHEGKIAEMKTGEGKTLVATLPIVLNAMKGKGVHLVTVNDYLASRDAQEMNAIYEFLGYSVGVITNEIHDDMSRKAQYMADITYGTNNEFGFDYLRDNMKYASEEKVQREHHFVIVDEVDSILIDEARTPLIISGPTNKGLDNYSKANDIALTFIEAKEKDEKGEVKQESGDFVVDEKNKSVILTESGVEKSEKGFDVDNLYSLENAVLSHHIDQALKSNYIFHKDVDYVVKEGEVIIIDEFTGRLSEGRRFSEGLHQALEAKEGVVVQEESQTLADITFQNYFRMYDKLAGMTGTAQTEATEFAQIYNLDVISIPTNLPIMREDKNDLIYKSELEKFGAVIEKIKELQQKGQPVLVGTASIEKSELLHELMKKEKVPHSVLNAKQHEQEAKIIENAGVKGAVTVATNMAGRGVDIKINDEVKSLGGLYIIGTERHESRRIDNQLRGRAGRQGDPGASQFYLSLEDGLLRIFGSDKIKGIMERLGIEEGEHIESKMVTRAVENAQKKVENLHYESRKHILEYDDVANEQRKVVYNYRNDLLDETYDIDTKVRENRVDYLWQVLARCDIQEALPEDEFDLDRLVLSIKEDVLLDINKGDFEGLDAMQIHEKLLAALVAQYEGKMQVVESKQRSEIERIVYLQVVDNAWREHLHQMDILKTGIGLRGYNQKDPLTEYKKESYELFMDLIQKIKGESIKTLHIIQLKEDRSEEEREAALAQMMAQMEAEATEDMQMEHPESQSEVSQESPIEKKVARNDLCPCGSGKKYKNCHGMSGPKKGLLAES